MKYKVKRADRASRTGGLLNRDFVYRLAGSDYGIASDDSRAFGIEYVAVTLNPLGDYPFFTIPREDIEEVK